MLPSGFTAIPFPIAPDEKTGSFTDESSTTWPASGLTTVSSETPACERADTSLATSLPSLTACSSDSTWALAASAASAAKTPAAFVFP